MYMLKEIVYYGLHRILWALLSIPSLRIRRMLLRMCGAKIGHVSIMTGLRVIAPWKLCIDNGSTINSDVLLDCRGGLCIGKNVMIGYRSSIHSMGHKFNKSNFPVFKDSVKINDGVIIYSHCYISPGVTMMENSTLLPCTVLMRTIVDKFEVYAGNPAVLRNKINPDVIRSAVYNKSPLGF